MVEAQTLQDGVKFYITWEPGNPYFYDFNYLDQLGMKYGYDIIYKEIKRQKKEKI